MDSIEKESLVSPPPLSPVTLSCYFASEDSHFHDLFGRSLATLKKNGHIRIWDEAQILAGADREQEQQKHLSTDQLLILLISADFLASDACWKHMQFALQRHQRGSVTVIPVLVRPCSWQGADLAALQMLPRGQKAVSSFPDPDEAWVEVAHDIEQMVNSIQPWAFVVCAPEDEAFVAHLQKDLLSSNIRLFSGTDQRTEMRTLIYRTSMVLLIVSSATTDSSRVEAGSSSMTIMPKAESTNSGRMRM